jgi:hypothetical protein
VTVLNFTEGLPMNFTYYQGVPRTFIETKSEQQLDRHHEVVALLQDREFVYVSEDIV